MPAIKLPLTTRNTIRSILSNKITTLQLKSKELKECITNNYLLLKAEDNHSSIISAPKRRIARYSNELKGIKNKLNVLHEINYWIKYPLSGSPDYALLPCELQIILSYLREKAGMLYSELEWTNSEIGYQRAFSINDGTIENRIEFLKLNVLKNERRKLIRKLSKLEEAIKLVKIALRGKSKVKKPLTLKRKIRKLWYSLLLNNGMTNVWVD